MNVFIDTNIYLTFYHYSSDDLEELKKLEVAIKKVAIKLQLTDQVISEFKRNREGKIYDALKKFEDQNLNNQFPQICKGYPQFQLLLDAIKLFNENKNEIVKKLDEDIQNNNLGADKIINALFTIPPVLETDNDVLEKAKLRLNLGNPPGKNNSLGDAINWEILLATVPNGEDLYLISDDKDYKSQIDGNKMAQFLIEEWKSKKASNIYFYSRLSHFFRDKFSQIKLASELEKELAISNLVHSSNFQSTHGAVATLLRFSDFTEQQINELIQAAIDNTQISWILKDRDLNAFYERLLRIGGAQVDPEKLEKFNQLNVVEETDIAAIEAEMEHVEA